jgi:hypothetical protein
VKQVLLQAVLQAVPQDVQQRTPLAQQIPSEVATLSPEKHLKEIPVLDAPPAEKPLPLDNNSGSVMA